MQQKWPGPLPLKGSTPAPSRRDKASTEGWDIGRRQIQVEAMQEEPQTLIPGSRHPTLPGHFLLLSGYPCQWKDWGQMSSSSCTELMRSGGEWGEVHYQLVFVVIDAYWDLHRARAKSRSKLWCLGRAVLHIIRPLLFCLSLPFTGLVGHPGLSSALHPLFTPSPRLCHQRLRLMWMQVYGNF